MICSTFLHKNTFGIGSIKYIRPVVPGPITIKYMIRPNIKKTTRNPNRNYCTNVFKCKTFGKNVMIDIQKKYKLQQLIKNNYLKNLWFFGTYVSSWLLTLLIGNGATIDSMIIDGMIIGGMIIGGMIIGAIGIFSLVYILKKPEPIFEFRSVNHLDKQFTIFVPKYKPMAYVHAIFSCIFAGLVMMPIVIIIGQVLVAQILGISVAVMIGSLMHAIFAKPESYAPYNSIIYSALTGFVGISMISIISALLSGGGDLMYLLRSFDHCIYLILFVIMGAIETFRAINLYDRQQINYYNGYLDVLNWKF
jgi:hypothetical protein